VVVLLGIVSHLNTEARISPRCRVLDAISMVGNRPLFAQVMRNTRRCNDAALADEIADALCQLDLVQFEAAWPRGLGFTEESRVLMDAIMARVGAGKLQHIIDRGFERRFNELSLQWAGAAPLGDFSV
jgi:hypothetical protein